MESWRAWDYSRLQNPFKGINSCRKSEIACLEKRPDDTRLVVFACMEMS